MKRTMKKLKNVSLILLCLVLCVTNLYIVPPVKAAENVTDYPVVQDAYVRKESATTNYNYENIVKAHGEQYVGKNYKVWNSKNYGSNVQITGLMKFELPTQEAVSANGFDTYELTFHIFKNADPNNCPQTYEFYYVSDLDWVETSVTYNTISSSIPSDASQKLFDFTIEQDYAYESLTDAEKAITIDVSDKVEALVKSGASSMTVFVKAKESKNTSLMVHTKESGDGSYAAKITASSNGYNLENLSALITECETLVLANYEEDGVPAFEAALFEAKTVNGTADVSVAQIRNAYKNLQAAKAALVAVSLTYTVEQDAYVRQEKATTNYNYENITQAHGEQYVGKNYKVWNSKYNTDQNAQIVGLMKLALPTQEEVNTLGFDKYEIVFNIFKNPNPSICPQTYQFFYATDVDWDETTVTWNTISSYIPTDTEQKLCDFTIEKDFEYEHLTDEQKRITVDVSSAMAPLVEQGAKSITIFVVAKESKNTSLMVHTKESGDGSYAAKLVVSKETGVDEEAPENIAFEKPARSNLSKTSAGKITDGSIDTFWSGKFYPSYVDVDLMDTYDINSLEVFIPAGKVSYYTIYGSNDGANYDRLYQKRSDEASTAEGDLITFDEVKSYRIIRVYLEYTQGDTKAYLSELRVYGEKTDTNEEVLRTGTLEEILGIKAYDETDYAQPITNDEIIENVYGIIDRTVGAEYRDWFTFELAENSENSNDYFELSDADGKILIKGNEGLSLTTGLNYYYKNYVNVHISEQTMQVNMPEEIVPIGGIVRKENPYEVRYAYNYCTLSYSFAFFGEEEWQRENDWLALNGVNVVLDLAGQEATWIKFLMNFGYSFDDAKDWLTGPAYYAWQFMDNMEVFGGPIPDGYVVDRVELARSSQRWKNSLGMQTVFQGYAGMVPTNFNEFQPDVTVVKQGDWNGFSRPNMIATDSETYDEYAALFYDAQRFVYGETSNYYAVDPFHEGGIRPSGLSDETIAKEVLESMMKYDSEAVWIVQGWQSNPTNGLLNGMGDAREDHVLIVDLIKYPISSATKYDNTSYGSTTLDSTEFNNTSWAWCLLANFGGNPSMHGQLEIMVNDILKATANSSHMKGIGIISEAMYDNPIVYDLLFDLAWADETFDLDDWMENYLERRYGGITDNIKMAWDIMKDANYDYGVRFTTELFGTKNKAPQSYGKQTIPYGAENLETALRLMLRDYDKFKENECYRYDLTEMMRQHVSNYAVLKYNEVLDAKTAGDLALFKELKAEFLNAFAVLNEVESTQKDQLGGEWIGRAEDRAAEYDDFAMDAFRMNAKALITSWGSKSGHNSLKDYGWRNYEGIFKDLYTANWTDYMNRVEANMETGAALNNISASGYFDIYWKWILGEQSYTRDAKDSPEEMAVVIARVLDECAISGAIDQNLGNIALEGLVSEEASAINDGDVSTIYMAEGVDGEKPEVIIDLIGQFALGEVQVLLEVSGDNTYTYEIYVSEDGIEWTKAAEKVTDELETEEGTSYKLDGISGRYLKVVGTEQLPIAEIRAYGDRVLVTLEMLEELIELSESLNIAGNPAEVRADFQSVLADAKEALASEAALDQVNSVYWALYDEIVDLNLTGVYNLAEGKSVTAHNDPSGNSARLVDGDMSTKWDAGRLSITGKPYEDTITPGWAIMDLEAIYDLTEIQIHFASTVWHHYEVYISMDGESWTLVAEHNTDTVPNANGDIYSLENVQGRYVKLALNDVQEGSDGKRTAIGIYELVVLGKEYVKEPVELAIIKQPVSASAVKGDNAVVTVEAQGEGLTYTWYYKNPGNWKFYESGSTFVSEDGTTYTIPMYAWRDGQEVYCVVSDINGDTVQSNIVTLTMDNGSIQIVKQPEDVVVATVGDVAVVTVEATGTGLTYQWYYKNPGNVKFYASGSQFVSEDGATYTIPVASWRDGQQVYCVITDANGISVQTNIVTLSVVK